MSRPTHVQVARAANFIHTLLQFRRTIDRESLSPVSLATLGLTLQCVCVLGWGGGRGYNVSFLPSLSSAVYSVLCGSHLPFPDISYHFSAKSRFRGFAK